MSAAVLRERPWLTVPLAILVALLVAAQHADASNTPARCSSSSLRLVPEQTQGTATQAVAFLSVANRGGACQLIATGSLTVMRNGVRVASIAGNPVSYRIRQTIDHGTTMLFDSWWANWCATRSGEFSVQGVLGALRASGPYHVLPACLGASEPSRLRGVRELVAGSVFKVTAPVSAHATWAGLRSVAANRHGAPQGP